MYKKIMVSLDGSKLAKCVLTHMDLKAEALVGRVEIALQTTAKPAQSI